MTKIKEELTKDKKEKPSYIQQYKKDWDEVQNYLKIISDHLKLIRKMMTKYKIEFGNNHVIQLQPLDLVELQYSFNNEWRDMVLSFNKIVEANK